MSALPELPVILVSAKSEDAASHIISEIIDNEAPNVIGAISCSQGQVWHIVNKYYEADVRLLALPDGAPPPEQLTIEGHIIYLTEDECGGGGGEDTASRRLQAGAGAAVRVLACETARLPAALRALAARHRLEPVALREPPAPPEPPAAPEPRGAAAARAALHAHVWPGLRRAPAGAADLQGYGDGGSSDSESSDGGGSSDGAAVERAECWAAALGALGGGSARAVRELRGAERRAAAEALVTAFASALGHDLDSL